MVFDVSKVAGIGEYEVRRNPSSGAMTPNDSLSEARSSRPSLRGSAAHPQQQLPDPPTKEHSARQPEDDYPILYVISGRAFLVQNKHTIEVRTDEKLRKLLVEKYESVMESRYFGRGGIEIVTEGAQLSEAEIEDLVRLSYNLTKG